MVSLQIIPSENALEYLQKISTCLWPPFKGNFTIRRFIERFESESELIIVDDGSTDDTTELLKKRYHNELTKRTVKLICSKKNLGVTGAKNLGIAHADSIWLLFLDSDDLLLPETAADMMRILKTHHTSHIIIFRCKIWRDSKTNTLN